MKKIFIILCLANAVGLFSYSQSTFYGLTSSGGDNNKGVIFSYVASSNTYSKLYDFNGANGAAPKGSLIKATDGKLYGMASNGGSSNKGVIFSYNPSGNVYTKLFDFNGMNGALPTASLLQGSDGKLYGLTSNGGNNNQGVIFSYDPINLTYSKLYDFSGGGGASPQGSLIQAADGKLYGVTSFGGNINNGPGYGVIFSYDVSGSSYRKLYDFDNINGSMPFGSLVQGTDNKLYGMTAMGGNGNGVIFNYDVINNSFVKLHSFTIYGGPHGNLYQAVDGKMYGIASMHSGVIFSYSPNTASYSELKNLNTISLSDPNAGLIQSSNGKLYGMKPNALFSFDPATSVLSNLAGLTGSNGINAFGSLLESN